MGLCIIKYGKDLMVVQALSWKNILSMRSQWAYSVLNFTIYGIINIVIYKNVNENNITARKGRKNVW